MFCNQVNGINVKNEENDLFFMFSQITYTSVVVDYINPKMLKWTAVHDCSSLTRLFNIYNKINSFSPEKKADVMTSPLMYGRLSAFLFPEQINLTDIWRTMPDTVYHYYKTKCPVSIGDMH